MSKSVPQIALIEASQKRTLPDFRAGDQVEVSYRIREGEKDREQKFKGVVIRRSKGGAGATFTVRKVSFGIGVERIFPENSPRIAKLEVLSRGKVRRARLYFLRELEGKKARLKQIRPVATKKTAEAAKAG